MFKEKILQNTILVGVCICYILSCLLPAFSTKGSVWPGYGCLISGWIYIAGEIWLFLVWLSNMILFFSVLRNRKNGKKTLWASAFAFLMSVSFRFRTTIILDIDCVIEDFKIGYYLWCLSMAGMFVYNLLLYVQKKREEGT